MSGPVNGVTPSVLAAPRAASVRVEPLVFLCALALMLSQTHVEPARQLLGNLRWVPLFVLAATGLFYVIAGPLRPERGTSQLYTAAWILFALSSSFYSIERSLTIERGFTLVLASLAIFGAGAHLAARVGDEVVLGSVVWAAVLVHLLCWVMVLGGGEGIASGRFRGWMENPNSLGLLTGVLLPAVLQRGIERPRPVPFAVLALLSIGLVLSGSRGGLLAAVVGCGYVVFRMRRGFVTGGLLALVVAWAAFVGASPTSDYLQENDYLRGRTLASGAGRIEVWEAALGIISERPLLGHGFGTEDLLLQEYGYGRRAFRQHQGRHFHNSYLGLAAQTGLLGALAFFGPLLFLAGQTLVRSWPRMTLDLTDGLAGVLVAGLIACFFESWIYSMGNSQAVPFWFLVMLLRRRIARP